MIITCPDCKARYNIKDSLIPEKGKNVRCKKCKTAFRAYTDGTIKRLREKAKKVAAPPAEVPPSVPPLTESFESLVHSTVRVDASTIQAAMKKQFPDTTEPTSTPETSIPQEEPIADEQPVLESSREPEESMADVSSPNVQSPFTAPDVSDNLFEQSSPNLEDTVEEPSVSDVTESIPDDIENDLNAALAAPSHDEDQFNIEDNDGMRHALFSNDEEDQDDEQNLFSDTGDRNPFVEYMPESKDKDPLTDSGNFGFSENQGNEVSLDDSDEDVPSIFDEPEKNESPFSMDDDMPGIEPEDYQSYEQEVKVPDSGEVQTTDSTHFDISIEGSVYQNIHLDTLDRWIREGRLLEKDQVSPSGLNQFATADTYPELSTIYENYFNSNTKNQADSVNKKKKGFFSKLFGR